MTDDSTNVLDLIFEKMSPEDMRFLVIAALGFKRHDVIEAEHAKLLYAMGLLQISPVKGFPLRDITLPLCCFRFTTAGRKAAQEIQADMGLSAKAFKTMPDPFEKEILDADFTLEFVMHDRRLLRELAGSRDRVRAVVERYPVGFEKELKRENPARPPFA